MYGINRNVCNGEEVATIPDDASDADNIFAMPGCDAEEGVGCATARLLDGVSRQTRGAAKAQKRFCVGRAITQDVAVAHERPPVTVGRSHGLKP